MPVPVIAVAKPTHPDDYLESVRRAGGEPRLVHAGAPLEPSFWTEVQGLLLTGGRDVDPRLYGEEPHPTYQPGGDRDPFELELLARALERDVPVLAICRGLQVLNVALGGTLVQHVPDQVPRALDHQVNTPPWRIAHEVFVEAGSHLARALGLPGQHAAAVAVNSRHHQAIKHVATGLATVATAPDGVIEAVERPASRFCVAVQWHPENFWRTGEFDALFRAFVTAAAATRT
jgi:putative glutamine amidotransferase